MLRHPADLSSWNLAFLHTFGRANVQTRLPSSGPRSYGLCHRHGRSARGRTKRGRSDAEEHMGAALVRDRLSDIGNDDLVSMAWDDYSWT